MKVLTSLLVLSTLLLTACESETKLAATSSNELKVKSSSERSYPGKPSAAVEMTYAMDKNIVAGELIEVTVTFTNTNDVDNLLVNFKLDSGLSLSDGLQQNSFGILAAGETSVVKLQVNAASNGFYYIHVDATLVTNKNQSLSFAIPVNVGNVDAQ